MVFQYARRCRWLLWLSGALVLSSLASTKAASSFRHALGPASEDQLNRQLSVNNSPVLDFNSINEERGPLPFPPPSPDALALFDEFVGTSANYKSWMEKLGIQIKPGDVLDQKAFDTVFPVLLKKQTEVQLRQLFHDPKGDFWRVTYQGKSLGLRLLQHWEKDGASDLAIMRRMLQTDSTHRNMLTDDPMLHTWISFSNGRNLGHAEYTKLLKKLPGTHDMKDVLRFYFRVATKSKNSNLKDAASQLTIGMYEDFYKQKWDRGRLVNWLLITDDEMEKMESVLHSYDRFAYSRSIDQRMLEDIAKAETQDKALADLLESKLIDKWLAESWSPQMLWPLMMKEANVLKRLQDRMYKIYLNRSH